MGLFLLAPLEKTQGPKDVRLYLYHKNNVTHHPFPQHIQFTVAELGNSWQLSPWMKSMQSHSFAKGQGNQFSVPLLQLMQDDWEGQALA